MESEKEKVEHELRELSAEQRKEEQIRAQLNKRKDDDGRFLCATTTFTSERKELLQRLNVGGPAVLGT